MSHLALASGLFTEPGVWDQRRLAKTDQLVAGGEYETGTSKSSALTTWPSMPPDHLARDVYLHHLLFPV